MTAQWQKELRLRPDGEQHVLSLLGAARVSAESLGKLDGDEIHLWLKQSPGGQTIATGTGGRVPPSANNLAPDRLLALRGVEIDSPRLSGQTERFEVWFAHEAAASAPGDPVAAAARPGPGLSVDAEGAAGKYNIRGDLFRVLVSLAGKSVQLRDVTLEGNARIVETQTAEPGAIPLDVAGDVVHVTGADSPGAKALVAGRPAVLSGRGYAMRGASVHLDRAANRAWVPGRGQLTLPMQNGKFGAPAGPAQPAVVAWTESLQFDGQTIALRGDVTAQTPLQRLAAGAVDVGLARRIDFAQPPAADAVAVATVKLHGQVQVENQTVAQ
ncbi:MAG: hypothetical protein KDA41_17515, partial [Planctomycetales bacterium]|nr:hypothetical protein [Planctomycetales bacterium]